MRILRLVIEGFGPFAGRQEIDFAPLDEAGLFLITGRTGSGKSSILDAICFALYGTAPRYDGAHARLRSDHAAVGTATRVELEFAVATNRWRVVRSPEYERPKQRGAGMTREPQAATLERWQDGRWAGVAARPVDVGEHLAPILQLTREQFLQVILLAQGRFQEFLQARSEDRLALLRALFGTERFERFEREITDRAKLLEQSIGTRTGALRADLLRLAALEGAADPDGTSSSGAADGDVPVDAASVWSAEVATRLAAAVDEAAARSADARAAFDAADRAEAVAVAVADRQRRRHDARAALAAVEADRAAIDGLRARIAEAVRVLPVLPAVEAAERTAARLALAEQSVVDARGVPGGDDPDPATAGAELDGLLGALADRLHDEQDLPRLSEAVGDAERARTDAAALLAALVEEAAALPTRRSALQEQRLRAEAATDTTAEAEAELARARAMADAVVAADRAAATVVTAEEAVVRALGDEQRAVSSTRTLVAARLRGAAGLLAADLQPDEPCPVCGALEHPHPAEADPGTPDDAAVAAAEAAQQRAADRRAAAAADASSARAEHAALVATTGGATADTADAAVRAAGVKLETARAATATRETTVRLLAELDARVAELDGVIAATRSAVTESAAAVAAASTAADQATTRVVAARQGHPSVAARIAALAARRAALAAAEAALRRRADAADAHRDAHERLVAALVETGIPDAAAARAAALPPPQRATLEQRVRAWEAARDGATAQLADRDVAGAPDEPADVQGAGIAKAEALRRRDIAADRLAAARSDAAVAQGLAATIATVDAAMAEDRSRLAVVGPLADVVRGGGSNALRMRLESYVLAARLEQIVAAANLRLSAMTAGRFTLHHDDGLAYRGARSGLGLEVLDEHTGRPRPVASLSGGETFLASLALALGLAEVVSAEAGGVRLDTLFVDEGFGSLDRETLDTAMETLDSLRAGGRTVGLISHVEAMQEDIPAGLHVERLPDGSSAVHSRVPAAV